MTIFNWYAEFFDGPRDWPQPARRTVIQADNAEDSEKIAKSQMGMSTRVEVRRAGTAAPLRTVYAREQADVKILAPAEMLPLAPAPRAPTVT